jgi:hypothetical protein
MINRLICYQDGRKSVYGTYFIEERYWYFKYTYKHRMMNSNSVTRTRMRKNDPSVALLMLLRSWKIKDILPVAWLCAELLFVVIMMGTE